MTEIGPMARGCIAGLAALCLALSLAGCFTGSDASSSTCDDYAKADFQQQGEIQKALLKLHGLGTSSIDNTALLTGALEDVCGGELSNHNSGNAAKNGSSRINDLINWDSGLTPLGVSPVSTSNATSPSISAAPTAPSRTVPPPTSDPRDPGFDAFSSAVVGDCVYYTKETDIEGMIKAPCDDPRVNSRVTKRTLDPAECPTGWVGAYKPQKDYSKPIPYDLVLCLESS